MFLVVYGHVSVITFQSGSIIGNLFLTFRMPLFFFISGFIGYKAVEHWNTTFYYEKLRKKAFVQLVPMTIFAVLYAFVNDRSLMLYIEKGPIEFWFTFVLFQMFLVYYSVSLFTYYLKKDILFLLLSFIAFLGIVQLLIGRRDTALWISLCGENTCKYFQFFVFGLFCKKHGLRYESILSQEKFKALIFVIFILSFCLLQCDIPFYAHKLINDIVVRYAGLLMVFIVFFSLSHYFDSSSRVVSTMIFVGRRTLDIYLLHCFFVPYYCSSLPGFITDNILIEFLCVSLVSVMVLIACLSISWILRRSEHLAYWCFGSKDLCMQNKNLKYGKKSNPLLLS